LQRLDRVFVCYRIGDPDGRFPIYDAAGSRLFPGRWNTAETPVIYASEYYSTAMIEKLAQGSGRIPPNQHYIRITVPNGISCETVTGDMLPRWSDRDRAAAQRFGSAWASELRSAILIVPSNPRHDDARSITHELPVPVWWDERLFSS